MLSFYHFIKKKSKTYPAFRQGFLSCFFLILNTIIFQLKNMIL